jgi:hypothetical protein
MVSSEVQRTLVKSPPELWAELSDPAALARHLGALGDVRITRTAPETTVEWEADDATGRVSIQPSGWGTKVTLSVSREVAGTSPPPPEPDESPEPGYTSAQADTQVDQQTPQHADGQAPAQVAGPVADSHPEPAAGAETMPRSTAATPTVDELAPVPDGPPSTSDDGTPTPKPPTDDRLAPAPDPRLGFFARLFRRRGKTAPAPAPTASPGQPDAFAAVSQALAPETFKATRAFAVSPAAEPPADQSPAAEPPVAEPPATEAAAAERPDLAAELMAAEEVAAEEVTAVLTAVLDRLGAAHHRPFSRA